MKNESENEKRWRPPRKKVIHIEVLDELGERKRATLSCGHSHIYKYSGSAYPKTLRCLNCERKKKEEDWCFPKHKELGDVYHFHESRWGSRKHTDESPTVPGKILDGGSYVCIGNQIIPKNWPNFDSLVAFLTQ